MRLSRCVLDKNWGRRPDSYSAASYSTQFPVVVVGAVIDTVETRIVAARGHWSPGGPTIDYDDDSATTGGRTGARADVFVVQSPSDLRPLRRLESHCPSPSWTVSVTWSVVPAARIGGAGSSRFVVVADFPSRPHFGPAPTLVACPKGPVA